MGLALQTMGVVMVKDYLGNQAGRGLGIGIVAGRNNGIC